MIRYLSRGYKIFKEMAPGDEYPEAHRVANRLFEEELERRRAGSDGQPPQVLPEGSPENEQLKAEFVPPYDPNKFPNKWRKMERDQPARTLMAHLGKDGYSRIHYDSEQKRTISVREAHACSHSRPGSCSRGA